MTALDELAAAQADAATEPASKPRTLGDGLRAALDEIHRQGEECRRIAERESAGRWDEAAIVERARQLQAERDEQAWHELAHDPDHLRQIAEVEAELREQRRQEELEAYWNSPQAERDYQDGLRALREHGEDLVQAAFRERADELGAMTFPAGRTESRSRERRDSGGRSSARSGDSGSSDPDLPEPAEPGPDPDVDLGLRAARWYARQLDLNVLPGSGREPLVPWGRLPDRAPTDEQLDRWWRRFPGADVDWLVGPRFAVLDVDVREAHDGRDELHELERTYRPLPVTPRALTPRDGFHVVFRVRPGVTVPAGEVAPGVDLRTGRRIIALPPGHGREWELSPVEVEIAELPDWVIALARTAAASANGTGAARGNTSAPREPVAHGGRHYFLKGRGIRFARGGIVDAREIEVLLEAEFAAFCVPLPAPEPGSIRRLAQWCARFDIAERERWLAERGTPSIRFATNKRSA